jgi:hypothetical protein
MPPKPSAAEILAEVSELEKKHRSANGLSFEEWRHLRDLTASLGDHFRAAGVHEDRRRKDVRLPVACTIALRIDDTALVGECCEYSKSGLFIELSRRLPPGTEFHLDSLALHGESYPLNVDAVVVWENVASSKSDVLPSGVGVKFIGVGKVGQQNISRLYDQLLDKVIAHHKALTQAVVLRDQEQRVAVCHALLRKVGLDGLWNDDGPTAKAKEIANNDGRPLWGSERVLMMFAWRVWNGSSEMNAIELWHLDEADQDSIITLLAALGHKNADLVDLWLSSEQAKSLEAASDRRQGTTSG